MRYIFSLVFLFSVTLSATSQQINPVPDYIFRNSMSVGRNAPTDTSAYFSIGPRFGATRGFMPPMVVDTAAMTGTKRNGLLIYSIQRNSFLYWDSTGSRWSRIAANLDTLQLATRAWRQKGIDSVASVRIGGSGVTGYIPKSTATRTLDSSQIFQSGGNIGIGTATPSVKVDVLGALKATNTGTRNFITSEGGTGTSNGGVVRAISGTTEAWMLAWGSAGSNTGAYYGTFMQAPTFLMTNGSVGQILYNTTLNTVFGQTADAGYKVDVQGTLRSTGATYLASAGGASVGIGTTSPISGSLLDVYTPSGNARPRVRTDSPSNALLNFHNLTTGTSETDGTVVGLRISDTASVFGNLENRHVQFISNGTDRMRIHANGRVGINTSTDAGYQFDVNGTARTGTLTINTNGQSRAISTNTASGTDGFNIFIGGGGTSINGTTGNQSSANTSIGVSALGALTTGNFNTSIGYNNMILVTTGSSNTGIGNNLTVLSTGSSNTAIGQSALNNITSATQNTAVGHNALVLMTSGNDNIAMGFDAGRRINSGSSNTTSSNSIYIGKDSRASAVSNSNEIVIGGDGRGNGSNTVTIGNSSTTDNYFTGALRTSAPPGGTANAWRLGTVATVTPTSPNRTIEVSIGGTIYYIHAKTTND